MSARRDPGRADLAACDACLERTWLISRLAGHLDVARGRIAELLELDDGELLDAIAGRDRSAIDRERSEFSAGSARGVAARAGLTVLCACDPRYPLRLHDLSAPPAVLHIAGSPARFLAACSADPVAIVGTREPTPYGAEVAAGLSRQLTCAGVPVVSGMARGIDAAAHVAALGAGDAMTIAVLPGGAERPYPRTKRALYIALVREAAVVSEMPPGTPVRRWMFPARNRIIAALAEVTVVVEAGERSGALVTARAARGLGRAVGAVPGRVTTPQAAGPHELLAGGAAVITDAGDVIELLFGAGAAERIVMAAERRPPPSELQAALLRELEGAPDAIAALARAGLGVDRGLTELAALELAGWVRRGAGGSYTVIP